MKRVKLIWIIVFGVLITEKSFSQKESKTNEFYNEEFKWSIEIPGGHKRGTKGDWMEFQKKFKYQAPKNQKLIFLIENDPVSFLFAYTEPYKASSKKTYRDRFKKLSNELYEAISDEDDEKVDSTSSEDAIDSVRFLTVSMVKPMQSDLVLYFTVYARSFEDKELIIGIFSADLIMHVNLLNALRNSKFNMTTPIRGSNDFR